MSTKLVVLAAVLAVIVTGVGIFYSYFMTAPESLVPTSDVPEGLRILGYDDYVETTENVTFFVVTGVLQNNHTSNVCYINVTATYYDDRNQMIAQRVGYGEEKIVKPRRNSPFRVFFLLNSSAEAPARYELEAICLKTNDEPVQAVVAADVKNKTGSEYYYVSGKAENTGARLAYSVKVFCAYYNAQGGFLGLRDTYVSTKIDGGASASFNVSSEPHRIVPAAYELFVIVHHYEIVPVTNLLLLVILIIVSIAIIIYMKERKGW